MRHIVILQVVFRDERANNDWMVHCRDYRNGVDFELSRHRMIELGLNYHSHSAIRV